MKRFATLLTALLTIVIGTISALATAEPKATPKLLWITKGFAFPESPVYDPLKDIIYVSNMGSMDIRETGKGTISKVTTDGNIVEREWVKGLKAPNGIAVRGNRLYVVDLTRLLVVDTDSGKIIEEYPAPGAVFLDGIGADENGENVFVSDYVANTIWRLSGKEWGLWVRSPKLDTPNAMVAEKDRLVLLTHGLWAGNRAWAGTQGQPDRKGHLLAIDYKTKAITTIGEGHPIAHADGFRPDGKGGYLVTDFAESTLLRVDAKGNASEVMRFDQCDNIKLDLQPSVAPTFANRAPTCGPSDMNYFPKQKLLLVPLMLINSVAAYSYEP
jgi:sugar lactone lactonase YvrE